MSSEMPKKSGAFIVLDGVDGSGTTTQTRKLCEHYQSKLGRERVLLTREPTGRPIGQLIRKLLRRAIPSDGSGAWRPPAEAIAMLFTADRIDHAYGEIVPALDHDRLVICDRYIHSTLVYQSLTSSYPIDNAFGWLLQLSRDVVRPDLVIILDIPAEEGERRLVSRDGTMGVEIYETLEIQQRIAKFYRETADPKGAYGPSVVGCEVVLVDGTRSVDEVFVECVRLVDGVLAGR